MRKTMPIFCNGDSFASVLIQRFSIFSKSLIGKSPGEKSPGLFSRCHYSAIIYLNGQGVRDNHLEP